MSVDMIAPQWMHAQITAEEYESWSEEQCAGIEIVDGMVVVGPSASKRHNRLARVLANALDASAGPDWNADTDFDVRLQDVPLTNRRPDVVVHRADTIDVTPTRPEHVLLAAEIVAPGSETTDRVVKLDQYARAGIPFYWRVELTATRIPSCTPTCSSPRAGATGTATYSPGSSRPACPSRSRSTCRPSDSSQARVPSMDEDPSASSVLKPTRSRSVHPQGSTACPQGCP
jgi:Uma2 family endonuclease